ncbi:MAG: peptidylprolyl isomerase [Xanthomonadales bacterium]|jgi:peptidyl-prolyl cis-trans isomerase A (cyclophilin A)|nr:peptidylprolyl isomerase [Xanthomonadales bacterium]MDH3924381.1 peptidylprolyl isomerase [Xanthomonadales bacterium]MDH3939972.1 peptidylprolyl isomerase [Xanthomonadales bacterium]MDH4002643.1 peptidylprolyl isomerase [Xanthomonadales bacterium]
MRLVLQASVFVVLYSLFAGSSLAEAPDCFPEEVIPENMFPSVRLETSMGDIIVELDRLRAPVSSNNFLRYVLEKKYDNTIFHRVMPGFVVQGGGYTETLEERELHPPIINESGNGLKNMPMTIAMARFDDPHSASNQFYFNLSANSSLDPNPKSWGYAVFGQVITGQEVVEAISNVDTGYSADLDASDVPLAPVKLLSATVLEEPH